jgi:tight adherence protein C
MRTVFGILTFMSVWFFLGEFIKYVDKKPLLEQIRAKGSDVSRFNRSFSGRMLHFAGELGKVFVRLSTPARIARLNSRLASAGYPLDMGVEEFIGIRIIMSLVFAAGFGLISGSMLGGLIAGGVIGYLYPGFWLSDRIAHRKKVIARDLPFAVDLLAVAVDAGLGLDSAISRIIHKGKKGLLRDVLNDMLNEVRLGKSRNDAFRCVADRVSVRELSSFVSTLQMAERFGTSVGQILRVLSHQTRLAKLQKAEATALKAPVKMVFPMVLFIFPTILIMLLGPVLLNHFVIS